MFVVNLFCSSTPEIYFSKQNNKTEKKVENVNKRNANACTQRFIKCITPLLDLLHLSGQANPEVILSHASISEESASEQQAVAKTVVQIITPIPKNLDQITIGPKKLKALETTERIRLGTYNILFPQIKFPPDQFCTKIGYSADSQGVLYNNLDARMNTIQKNILKANLDVVCLQEVTRRTYEILLSALDHNYNIILSLHEGSFHGVAVIYKKHRFNKLASNSVNVSIPMNAEKFENKYFKNRVHLIVDLQDATSKKVFRVVSCHLLDPRNHIAKDLHSKEVVDSVENRTATYAIDRTIIAGDMNQDQFGDKGVIKRKNERVNKSELSCISAFKPFLKHNYHIDGSLEPSNFYKNDWGNSPILAGQRRIDWIWSKHFRPITHSLSNFDNSGSDHALVASVIC